MHNFINPVNHSDHHLKRELSTAMSVKIDRQSKVIANGDGISLLRRLELRLHDKLDQVRRVTLNQWSKFRDLDLSAIRNNWVHGGDVRADIDVIGNYGPYENDGGVRWRNAFKHAYGVSFDDIRGKDAPIKFYLTLNRRASVIHIHAWKKVGTLTAKKSRDCATK